MSKNGNFSITNLCKKAIFLKVGATSIKSKNRFLPETLHLNHPEALASLLSNLKSDRIGSSGEKFSVSQYSGSNHLNCAKEVISIFHAF